MSPNRKVLALSVGLLIPLSAASLAQPQKPDNQTLVVDDAMIAWYQISSVSALRPGVIDKMELRVGKEVGRAGDVIGVLHKEVADLAVKEAEIQAKSSAAVRKAEAQIKLAAAVVSRNDALLKQNPNYVSREEVQKAEAEFLVATAGKAEAVETQELAKAKLESAKRAAEEHVVRAPFSGMVVEELKHEGESVQANEAVVKIGNLDKMRVWAYVPVEYSYRVAIGTEVEIQVRLNPGGARIGKHPIELKKFRGVVTFVDPELQSAGENGVKVYADLDNPNHEIRPGFKAAMTFFLKPETTQPLGAPENAPEPAVGNRTSELPALPR